MNHKRKQNYVDAKVQGALLKRIVLHWFSFFAVAAIAIILLQAMLSGPQGEPLSKRIVAEASEFTLVGLILLCIFPAFLLDTIRFSNRFVGPVGRLRKYLRQLGEENDTSKVSFRGGDFWSEMADEFNAVATLVENQQAEIDRLKGQLKNSGVTSRS
jgi:nitrogen fixation/metabolism regulation signal transduction histidine kinase